MATKKKTARPKAAKRELIDTGTNKLYVRRNARGTSFKEVQDVGRSLAQDRRRKARTVASPDRAIAATGALITRADQWLTNG